MSLKCVLRHCRFVHAGTPFHCCSYHVNLTPYICYIKHLFWCNWILCAAHWSAFIRAGILKIGVQCTEWSETFQLFPLRHSVSIGCRHRTWHDFVVTVLIFLYICIVVSWVVTQCSVGWLAVWLELTASMFRVTPEETGRTLPTGVMTQQFKIWMVVKWLD
jgi:hypothetical protein